MAEKLLGDENFRMITLMRLTIDAVVKAEEKEMLKHGISPTEAAILFITQCIGERAIPAEIAAWMLREHTSVSALLRRMEKKGLVELTKDLDRKNLIRVSLTEKGKQAYLVFEQVQVRHRIAAVLSKEERGQFTSCLSKLREKALEELSIEYRPPFP